MKNITPKIFDGIFEDAFSGLVEYYPSQLTDAVKESLKSAIQSEFHDTGNNQEDYQMVRNAIERELTKRRLVESNAEGRYNQTCNEQGWNGESQIIHLEGFIRDKGLFEEFAAYATKAAEEENVETGHADRQPG